MCRALGSAAVCKVCPRVKVGLQSTSLLIRGIRSWSGSFLQAVARLGLLRVTSCLEVGLLTPFDPKRLQTQLFSLLCEHRWYLQAEGGKFLFGSDQHRSFSAQPGFGC